MTFGNITTATYHFSDGFSDVPLMPIKPGLAAYFGRTENGGTTEYVKNTTEVKWDTLRGKENRSKLLRRSPGGYNVGDNAKVNKAALFTTKSSDFPQVMSPGAIEAKQLLERIFNEPSPGVLSTEQRMRWYANQIYGQMVQDIANTFIVKGWESIRTSKMTLDDGSGDFYDWNRSTSNNAIAGALWTVAGTDILTDIDARCDKVEDNGKVECDFILPGIATWAGMKQNTQLTSEADNRGYLFIRAGGIAALPDLPSTLQWLIDAGLKYQAWIQTPAGRELFVLTSNSRVTDPDSGLKVKLMPDDEVLFGFSGSPCDRKFGPMVEWGNTADDMETASRMGIDIMSPDIMMPPGAARNDNLLNSQMFHIKTKPTRAVTHFEMESNPLFITKGADHFALLTGTA